MTRLGFLIDHSRCIGCHACTVACKQEHGTELGVFRTWVKYVEHGAYPDTRRSFAVLRCNHCDDAPCVAICPTTALFRRDDGVVDFDPRRCIGCKACMNACPYDALHIDPRSQTAAKCNFCAHRVDMGLQPACEVVCPAGAIVSGDLDDPTATISRMLAEQPSAVRAPEQGTLPKLHYVGADPVAIDPLAAASGEAYLTTEVPASARAKLGALPDEAAAITVTDVAHPAPWGWRVSSYFLSKGIAAGAMMLAALHGGVLAGALALAGIAVTGAFLVWDLTQPRRFAFLFTKPQWRSWLALGAQAIDVAALLALAYTVAAIAGWGGARDVLRWALIPAGALLAGYTAFLFGQCEGRDLWQSPLLLPHTLVNALLAGAGALAIGTAAGGLVVPLAWVVAGSAAASGLLVVADLAREHPTAQARRAARNLWRDLHAGRFRAGVALGMAAPLALAAVALATGAAVPLAVAGALALAGLWLYEDAWVRAGQSVPLS